MSLLTQIDQTFTEALKTQNETKLSTLRLLRAALTNKQKESGGELGDEQVLQVLKQEAKKRDEAAKLFEQAGNGEQAAKERAELALIKAYLPAELPDEAIQKVIDEVKSSGTTDFGQLMGQVMARVKGKADGSRVAELVKKILA